MGQFPCLSVNPAPHMNMAGMGKRRHRTVRAQFMSPRLQSRIPLPPVTMRKCPWKASVSLLQCWAPLCSSRIPLSLASGSFSSTRAHALQSMTNLDQSCLDPESHSSHRSPDSANFPEQVSAHMVSASLSPLTFTFQCLFTSKQTWPNDSTKLGRQNNSLFNTPFF